MYIIQKLEHEILQAVKAAVGKQYTPAVDELAAPPDSKFGDIAFPCFHIAKGLGRSPAEIAAELAPKIEPKGLITKIEARGPYINFFIDANALAAHTLREASLLGSRYGTWSIGRGKRVMVEYAQPNTHKAIHVGHVRNFVLGASIVNLLRATGFNVITASYHGDIGMHVATTLWGLTKFHAAEVPPKRGRGLWLGMIYTEAVQRLETNPEEKVEVLETQKRLEAGDRVLARLWKRTRRWSIEEFSEVFRELGVEIDRPYYESEMEEPGRKVVASLLRRGIARESEGALVAPLEDYNLGTFLMLKSDGGTLYATRDLALAEQKFKEFKFDRSIHVVDTRQMLYFKQLAKTLELMGFVKPMVHVPYEFVTLKEGAMSSRKGTIVRYEELRDEVLAVACHETKKRHPDWSERDIQKTSWRIAMAAIKFSMLAQDVSRPIVFDIRAAASFDGFTGPYIQYTGARIAGILRKAPRSAGRTIQQFKNITIQPAEKTLLFTLAHYPKVVLAAQQEMRPTPLAEYLWKLAKSFSEFYETVPVLKAAPEERAARLRMIRAVRTVLENGAKLLGFEIPKEM